MVNHPLLHRFKRSDDPFASPTVSGITGAQTAAGGATTATQLAQASNAAESTQSESVNGIAANTVPSPFTSSSSSLTSSTSAAASQASTSDASSISMGTVIGACVGTLAGVLILILLGVWLYRRSDPTKKRRRPFPRSGPGLQPNWNKLGDDEDRWEGMHKDTKAGETVEIAPMEKLTMFKKSTPSVRTAYTTKTTSEELPPFNFDSHPFSQYHPNLAKELATLEEPPAPTFLNKMDSRAVSWDGDTVGGSSFLSSRSNRMSGSMSPSLDIARPTPALTNSEPHRWESAEVVNLEGHVAEVVDSQGSNNPFLNSIERRKSQHNPFFGASAPVPKNSKSKGREITPPASRNPFADANDRDDTSGDITPTRPTFSHSAVGSVSSVSSNDRAIQSLIAALDTTPEEVQARLRVADIEPSLRSDTADSIYTTAEYNSDEDEEDVTDSFPLPPGSEGSAHSGHSS
ncbi:hypothetical protein GYMLUDRAFT_483041 [Collybiopsis luxurians FD-317 M1]|uniref:Uncharacterized protein n=1 Tax=Collybiopsis luxurians FD-317 M1 TaxID=944289 RepID=A0A0D0D1S7_9AGAR|nr:hypothetical protein GYMLUDRAFT_483041 [Collybiopsis luxurians FD-317 M1]